MLRMFLVQDKNKPAFLILSCGDYHFINNENIVTFIHPVFIAYRLIPKIMLNGMKDAAYILGLSGSDGKVVFRNDSLGD
jgi:hypothetical protein